MSLNHTVRPSLGPNVYKSANIGLLGALGLGFDEVSFVELWSSQFWDLGLRCLGFVIFQLRFGFVGA